jgi:F0F1-type ATP synthase epsilon subunit
VTGVGISLALALLASLECSTVKIEHPVAPGTVAIPSGWITVHPDSVTVTVCRVRR